MQDINRMIDDVSNLRRKNRWFIEDRIYRFRNIEFDMIDILRCFITEYVYYLLNIILIIWIKKNLINSLKTFSRGICKR